MIFNIFAESKNSFEGIHPDETVMLLVRRHWFVPVAQLIGLIIAAGIALIVVVVGAGFITRYGLWGMTLFFGTLYTMVLWYCAFYMLTLYCLDTWIVTNHRIIESQQKGFFDRSVAEVSLSRIQDVSIETAGIIPTFFNFGTIKVQSAGADVNFTFADIPNPSKMKEEIMRLSGTYSPPSGTIAK